ncbi:MAG: hypothetical protein ACK442_13945 [Novosphingobium sp.]|nr:hypothetical protein [Novosphingobium sp.]
MRLVITATLIVLPAGAALAAPTRPTVQPLTCTLPVNAKDSAVSLKRRYGRAAVVTTVPGPEGTTVRAVVLWPREPARRLEVTFWDERMTQPAGVTLGDQARRWSVGGVKLGDSLQRVEALNGRPFQLGGFEWDYGGYLQDAKGGKLGVLPGGCRVSVRLGLTAGAEVPLAILGDVTLQSTDKAVQAARPVVTDLSIGWPARD